ncbi:MAG: type II 3-dehydroquinate dehydratase [Flavobacteriales bacterium]
MKKILIINGPNLNLLGIRNTKVYGDMSFKTYLESVKIDFIEKLAISYHQTNHEGEIIDLLHQFGFECDGIVLNAGGYTHTSVAIRDAIEAITTEVVEVHISNIYARESFRHKSLISSVCTGQISGFGLEGYKLALQYFV